VLAQLRLPVSDEDAEDIKFLKKGSEVIVKSATVHRLVEHLTSDKLPDVHFLKSFLLTYRSFLQPTELLQKLVMRYCTTPPTTTNAGMNLLQLKEERQLPIRLRVLSVIKFWVENHFHDFKQDATLAQSLLDFVDNTVSYTSNSKFAISIKAALEKRMAGENPKGSLALKTAAEAADSPVLERSKKAKETDVLDFEPVEIARQLSLLTQDLFKKIKPEELLGTGWMKKDKLTRSPGVCAVIRHFNRVNNVVLSEILKREQLSDRKAAIKKCVVVASECAKLGNFDSVMAISSAFENQAVFRLRKTWEALEKENDDFITFIQSLTELPKNHYARLRDKLRQTPPPVLPYLGMYLTDLNFIEEQPNSFDGGLVNFFKFHTIANTIREIQQFQLDDYTFKPLKEFRELLAAHEERDDKELFAISQRLEPPPKK